MGMSCEFPAGLAVGVLVSLLAASPPVAADHVGVLQLNQEPTGPYAVSVWTEPGTIHARRSGAGPGSGQRPSSSNGNRTPDASGAGRTGGIQLAATRAPCRPDLGVGAKSSGRRDLEDLLARPVTPRGPPAA